jgi:hypothetical protein
MLLRRVTEHAKAQNWFAVALDFLIVVVGVFIGIEVANWNEARHDRQEERRYYGQLLVDLRADLATLARAEERADRHDQAAQMVLDRLDGLPTRASRGRLAKSIHLAGFIYIPQASRGTYDELIGTGNLRLLRNGRLKSEIANYYGDFEENRQWDSLLRDQQSDYWADTAGIVPRAVLRAAIRGVEPIVTVEEDREIWARARSHSRLPNMLIGMASYQERVRRDSELQTARATRLIDDIERHLKDIA